MSEPSAVSFYNLQPRPSCIVVIVLGLAGTENSVYLRDLVDGIDKSVIIISVRGFETSHRAHDEKIFMKNNPVRIQRVMEWIRSVYSPGLAVYGIGISLGGALLLQHQACSPAKFDRIAMISATFWYEHAVQTMAWLPNRVLAWWQFVRLWYGNHVLTCGPEHARPSLWQWMRLLFACSLLTQDRILCELYGADYREYLNSLDMRQMIQTTPRVYYLLSTRDMLCSPEHLRMIRDTLARGTCIATIVDFGGHGEFTLNGKRNDYLVEYCRRFIAGV
jgi:hypothetical protein